MPVRGRAIRIERDCAGWVSEAMARGVYPRQFKYQALDPEVERLAKLGHSAHSIGRMLGVRNQAIWASFNRLGLVTNREPAPPGAFWGLLTAGTVLEGAAYPREAA